VKRENYNVGVPRGGFWKEVLNSDEERFGGGSVNNAGGAEAKEVSMQGRPFSLSLTLPGLSTIFLKSEI
jgi:1,4-alpha-glucan branching enzyme